MIGLTHMENASISHYTVNAFVYKSDSWTLELIIESILGVDGPSSKNERGIVRRHCNPLVVSTALTL